MISPTTTDSFLRELEKIAKKRKVQTFGGRERLSITPEERYAFGTRIRKALNGGNGVGRVKTSKGFAVNTHRSYSGYYSHPSKIPLAKIRFVESTG